MGIDQIFNLENEIFGGLLGVTSIGLVAAMSKKAAQVSNFYKPFNIGRISEVFPKLTYRICMIILKHNLPF